MFMRLEGTKSFLPIPMKGFRPEPCRLFQRQRDFQNAFSRCVENSNRPGWVGVLGLCMWQYDRTRAVIQVVNVDDLRLRILNVRYGEADRLDRLRRSKEAGNRNGKYSRHLETDRRRSVISLGCYSAIPSGRFGNRPRWL
jgi:hypothetical protein